MNEDALKTVYLIASGPTEWEERRRIQGNTNLPLREEGTESVRCDLAEALAGRSVRTIHTAPDEASGQTAAVAAETLGATKVKGVPELAEMNLGLWQGLTEAELQERYPKVFGRWRAHPANVSIPEGESFEGLEHRIASTLDRLIRKSGDQPIVLVLRPVVLKLCGAWLGEGEPGRAFTLQTGPPPPVQCFQISRRAWRARRPPRRRKRISA